MLRLFLRVFSGLLACLLLAGCFDIKEELWVHSDGSGKAELTYVIPASALLVAGGTEGLEKKIRDMMATQPKLRLDALEVKETESGVRVAARISTDSLLALLDLKKNAGGRELPGAAMDLAGNFDVRLIGLDVDFARTVKVREALGLASFGVSKDDREKRKLIYILHLPKPAKESNAMTTEDDGKTLKWEATLGEAMKKPLVTSFRASMPIPPTVWYGLALVLVAITALARAVWKWRTRLRMKRVMDAEAG
ncbi:hypothetical protein [Haloferula sp. BvORR071]|uniref:hypothetical protein n=1 Tax=Haloferula sp. BvORR071 TaxID=1396141 RepID=UPI00055148F4|nr:hypothetical protein [Haloferula sp. BvORR071]